MRNIGSISLTALLTFLLGSSAAAQVRVAPVRVKAAPTTVGVSGAGTAGGAVRIRALAPIRFNPSVLPTLPALNSPSVRAKINAITLRHAPVKLLPRFRTRRNKVSVQQSVKSHPNVPTFAAGAVADAPVVEERPAETSERKKVKTSEADKLRQASEKLEKSKKGRSEIGSLNNIFDGGLHRRGTPAVRTDAEREGIASKTSPKRDYLKPVQDFSGRQLLGKLQEISGRGYRSHGYKEARKELFSNTDNFKKNGVRGVVAAYSDIFVPGQGADGTRYRERGDANGDGYSERDGMNVEHLWPQSYFNQRAPMRSDLHHLMATFSHPNSSRSRYPFGEVPNGAAEYNNNAGAKLGNGLFEPPDGVKGRVARGMLYFFTRYQRQGILPHGISRRFWNSRVEMFMRWNREHPPDAFEMRRNDLVEEYQGNRNPFIDDPGLADRIGAEGFTHESGESNHRIVQAVGDGAGVYESYARSSGKKHKKRGHRKKNRKHGR